MDLRRKHNYIKPTVEMFYVEQKLSYLSYFSGTGSVDGWETGEELDYDEIDEP